MRQILSKPPWSWLLFNNIRYMLILQKKLKSVESESESESQKILWGRNLRRLFGNNIE